MADISQIPSSQAYQQLSEDPQSVLVDVRTQAEWTFVGVPDLPAGRAVFLSWQEFPGMAVDPDFVAKLSSAVGGPEAQDRPLLFLCRSGGRSQAAATAMAAAGFTACANISDGFEGDLDGERKRGRVGGWKAAGLPWIQN